MYNSPQKWGCSIQVSSAHRSHASGGSLKDAAVFYSGIHVGNVTTLAERLQAIDDAAKAKNVRRFTHAFAELTSGCNEFIVIKQPSDQPFGNQQFTPKGEP
jgi:hypothetical protein